MPPDKAPKVDLARECLRDATQDSESTTQPAATPPLPIVELAAKELTIFDWAQRNPDRAEVSVLQMMTAVAHTHQVSELALHWLPTEEVHP